MLWAAGGTVSHPFAPLLDPCGASSRWEPRSGSPPSVALLWQPRLIELIDTHALRNSMDTAETAFATLTALNTEDV